MKITFDTDDACDLKEGDIAVYLGKVIGEKPNVKGDYDYHIAMISGTTKFKTDGGCSVFIKRVLWAVFWFCLGFGVNGMLYFK